MVNFTAHRFQVSLAQSIRDPLGSTGLYEIDYNDMLIKSKEKLASRYCQEYKEKLEKEAKKMKRQLGTDFDELKNKSIQQSGEIEKRNLKIANLK